MMSDLMMSDLGPLKVRRDERVSWSLGQRVRESIVNGSESQRVGESMVNGQFFSWWEGILYRVSGYS